MKHNTRRTKGDEWRIICTLILTLFTTINATADCNGNLKIVAEKATAAYCLGDDEPATLAVKIDGSESETSNVTFHWFAKAADENDWSELATERSIAVRPTSETQYKVYAQKEGCPSNTENFTIEVRKPIVVAFPSADTTVCKGVSMTLKNVVKEGNPTQFFWDGNASTGGTHTLVGIKKDMTLTLRATDGVCHSEEATFNIIVRDPITFTLTPDQSICQGDEASIRVRLKTGKATAYKYFRQEENGVKEEFFPEGRNLYETPMETTTYTVTIESDVCPSVSQSSTVFVDKPQKLTLRTKDDQTQVCQNTELPFLLEAENCDQFQWEMMPISTMKTKIIGNGNLFDKTIKMEESALFRVVSTSNKVCPKEASNEVMVRVDEPIQLKIKPTQRTICEGETIQLSASLVAGSSENYGWNKLTDGNETQISDYLTTNDRPTKETRYVVWAKSPSCPMASDTIDISVEKIYTPTISTSSNSICAGEELQLNGTFGDAPALQWKRRSSNEPLYKTISTERTTEITDTPQTNASYCLVVSAQTACPEVWSDPVEVNVEKQANLKLEAAKKVCQGETVVLNAETNVDANLITWQRINDKGTKEFQPNSTKVRETISERTTYIAVAQPEKCPSVSDEITIDVDIIPEFQVSASSDSICEGNELILRTDFPYAQGIQWDKARLTQNDYAPVGSGQQEITTTPTHAAKYRMTAQTEFGCKVVASPVIVHFSTAIATKLGSDTTLCEGEPFDISFITNNVYQYEWAKDSEFTQRIPHEEMQSFTPTQTETYYLRIRNGCCKKEQPFHLEVVPMPQIVQTELVGYHSIRVEAVGGTGNYSYNFGQGFSESDVFENARYNTTYKIQVKDDAGCQTDTTLKMPSCEIEVPTLFTPNGDGINDQFIVENLERFLLFKLRIFDRHGRPLYEQNETNEPWDGSYNGHPLPSDDYWYIINIEENDEEITGHFTLLR